jgi:hypothetical protein
MKKTKRKKYATGTSVKNYMENPYSELQQNQINRIKGQAEAANNPFTQGLDVLGGLMMQFGAQGMEGQGLAGKVFDTAAYGGEVGKVPVEVEGDEVAETPDGNMMEFKGPSHEQGGIDADLEPGTEIYSDRIKVKGKTMADRKKKREGKKQTLESLLSKNPTDALTKNALKRTEQVNAIQEQFDTTVQNVVSGIESLQQFSYGGTVDMYATGGMVGDPPTKRAKLLSRLQGLGIAADQTPESFQNLTEDVVQGYLDTMFEQNPNIQRPAQAQATIANLMSKGDYPEVKTIAKTKFQIAEDPVAQEVIPGKTRDEIFAETRKQLEAQGVDPNTGTFDFNGKKFSTKLSPTGGSSKDKLPDQVIDVGGTNEILDADQYYKQKTEFAGGGTVWGDPNDPKKKTYSTLADRPPLYDNAEFDPLTIDFSNIPMTDSLAGADPMIANQFTNSYSGLPVQNGAEVTDANGNLISQPGFFDKLQGYVPNLTTGDAIGLAGNLYSSFAPMKNTKDAFSNMTPNINPFENYGQEGLKSMADAKGMLAGEQARALKNLELSKAGQINRGRNTARGVNQMRALDLAANLQGDQAASDINSNFIQMLMNLTTQEAGMQNQKDQVVMGGEGARDIADRQDLANYWSQLGRDKATLGEGLQQTGKDLNATKQNEVMMNLLNQLSKYGITVDSKGQLSTKNNKDGK